ncbi:hypothetical protein F5B21DRAFT_483376 [Xylaria acuta]|nr:hypothetical protein F5B21DRAFT_483376 [Xylaria acuta]
MDNLPQEIVDHVVSFIPLRIREANRSISRPLPLLATVSRRFQRAVEKRTFKDIYIMTTDTELDEFERIWNPQRRPNLRKLFIGVLVWCYRSEDLHEQDRYLQVDIGATTAPLRRLWNFLSNAWNEIALGRGNVDLTLLTSQADDKDHNWLVCPPLNLTVDAESLPVLPFVRTFAIILGFCH